MIGFQYQFSVFPPIVDLDTLKKRGYSHLSLSNHLIRKVNAMIGLEVPKCQICLKTKGKCLDSKKSQS